MNTLPMIDLCAMLPFELKVATHGTRWSHQIERSIERQVKAGITPESLADKWEDIQYQAELAQDDDYPEDYFDEAEYYDELNQTIYEGDSDDEPMHPYEYRH